MTLARRMTIAAGVWVAAVVLVAAAGLWGVTSLRAEVDASLAQYEAMRRGYEVGVHAWRAREALRADPPDTDAALGETLAALSELGSAQAAADTADFATWRDALDEAAGALFADAPTHADAARAALNTVISGVASRSAQARNEIQAIQQRAETHRWALTAGLALFATLAVIAAVVLGVIQHRAVMRPLRRIGDGVSDVAQGRFDRRLSAAGDRELAELARDFNRMADQLQALVEDLESQVRTQSAALARSERLASVGHLAAGVAHEINNPLGIIAAHAELALREADADAPAHDAMSVIRDEAFRCKAITERLLGLSRGVVRAEPTDLDALVGDVIEQARALPAASGRSITVDAGAIRATTDPSLVRQVVLNLLVNALEATGPGGRITVATGTANSYVVVRVTDDGRGITADALPRVFEPFYTTRRGAGPASPGTGLGLSISHAIAEQLGGSLTAASPGPGWGSTFTLRLPTTDPAS